MDSLAGWGLGPSFRCPLLGEAKPRSFLLAFSLKIGRGSPTSLSPSLLFFLVQRWLGRRVLGTSLKVGSLLISVGLFGLPSGAGRGFPSQVHAWFPHPRCPYTLVRPSSPPLPARSRLLPSSQLALGEADAKSGRLSSASFATGAQ